MQLLMNMNNWDYYWKYWSYRSTISASVGGKLHTDHHCISIRLRRADKW